MGGNADQNISEYRHFSRSDTFYLLLVNILHLEKNDIISTPVCLSLVFQEKEAGRRFVRNAGGSNI